MASPNTKNFYLPITRHHVPRGSDWGQTVGTDYWLTFNPAADLMATATAGTMVDELVDGGWVATSMINTAGAAQDFGGGVFTRTTSPGPKSGPFGGTYGDASTPNHALTNASGDILISPAVFGDAQGMEAAAILAGKSTLPRFLIADFWAAFTVTSADEVQTFVGFFEDGATASVEADQYAGISSGGTGSSYRLQGNAATMATLGTVAVVSTTWHKWKIVLQYNGASGPNVYAYMDGALINTTPGVGASDEFPLKFGMHVITNDIGLGLTHIYYDW